MEFLNNVSDLGQGILLAQGIFFLLILGVGIYQLTTTKYLRRSLAESLRLSQDTISEANGINSLAVACRTRYRNAAERIESVDAHLISVSELARFPIISIGKIRWSICQTSELVDGAPSFLVTLGLVGTFSGLIQNLSGLSSLLVTGNGINEQTSLIEGFASIFPVMGAAFVTSLVGILLGSIFWLVGALNGMTRLRDEITDLLCGYLEQVVQADCRRYSLVGESVERMQVYLDDYLSKFSSTIGNQIQNSIDQSIKRLVSALTIQVEEATQFVRAVTQGCNDLERAGLVFSKATAQLESSDFASDFSDACANFIDHTKLLSQTTEKVKAASGDLAQQAIDLAVQISKSCDVHQDISTALVQSSNSLEVSQKTAISTGERLHAAVDAMEGINKRGMTWLSMRAKTDSKLVGLTEQLQTLLSNFTTLADKITSSTYEDLSVLRKDIKELRGISNSLAEGARNNEAEIRHIKEGLRQISKAPQNWFNR